MCYDTTRARLFQGHSKAPVAVQLRLEQLLPSNSHSEPHLTSFSKMASQARLGRLPSIERLAEQMAEGEPRIKKQVGAGTSPETTSMEAIPGEAGKLDEIDENVIGKNGLELQIALDSMAVGNLEPLKRHCKSPHKQDPTP
jgi:hypothetical protein